MINSYPSIYNLGHAAIATLLHGPVLVEEKVDGSQISFRVVPRGVPGQGFSAGGPGDGEIYDLEIRSKGAVINTIAPEGMFKKAVEILQGLHAAGAIRPGYTYRGEYLSKPAHNVLAYDHVPNNHIIIFDIEYGEQSFVGTEEKARLAGELGMIAVPVIGVNRVITADILRSFLDRESILGGQKIEGVVIKPANYDLFGRDKKVLMGKFVSEAFKEVHAADWKKLHGTKSTRDIIGEIAADYGTPARWQKALQHLREAGKITDSPRDIGMLIAEVPQDIEKECSDELKEILFKWAWAQIRRRVCTGLATWYKESLLKLQFERTGGDAPSAMLAAGLSEKFPAATEEVVDHSSLEQVEKLVDEIARLENEGGPVSVPQEWGA